MSNKNKAVITSGLTGILAPNAMSTIELLNSYAKYIEEHAIQGEQGISITGIEVINVGDETYKFVATLSDGNTIETPSTFTVPKGENGKDALIAGYVFPVRGLPDTLEATIEQFQFSREPSIGETFLLIETNIYNGDTYVCIADVIATMNGNLTASIKSYSSIETPRPAITIEDYYFNRASDIHAILSGKILKGITVFLVTENYDTITVDLDIPNIAKYGHTLALSVPVQKNPFLINIMCTAFGNMTCYGLVAESLPLDSTIKVVDLNVNKDTSHMVIKYVS